MVRLAVGLIAAVLITGTVGVLGPNGANSLPAGAALPYSSSPAGVSVPAGLSAGATQGPSPSTANLIVQQATPVFNPYLAQMYQQAIARSMMAQNQAMPNIPNMPNMNGPPRRQRGPRRRTSPLMKVLTFLAEIKAAKDLDCKTVPEILGLDIPRYAPVSCDDKCPPLTACRNVGTVGFCCPFLVTDQMIKSMGVVERFKMLG